MLYAMIARDRPESRDKRLAVRPVHMQHLESLGERLVFAGALLGADGHPEGSLLVLQAQSLEAAAADFNADPFVTEGIFASVEIKPWRVAINNSGIEV